MGSFFSCPFAEYTDVENGLESVIIKSISFGDKEMKTPVRSVSFNNQDSEPVLLKTLSSGKMIVEGSVSFNGRKMETLISIKAPSLDKEMNVSMKSINTESKESPRSDNSLETIQKHLNPTKPEHEAATKLQKVYKSFRIRRKLADCAVLVEQSWWKLLDLAELKRSSVLFFDIEKHETAISRWSRARIRVAKFAKGLSKNDKARKLALQHWLEAIDPRHRYGHNLQFYYAKWLNGQSREPFFYWLDIGEGKEVNLVEKCPRSKLQRQCIKYLCPMERKAYEVDVEDGKFFYKQTGELLHTTGENADDKWIFVLSTSKTLYVGRKKKGTFQHSSFLAGGATTAAGRLVIESGILKAVWPHSGHYKPTQENFKDFISFLTEKNVDLIDVKMNPVDEEEDILGKQRSSLHLRNNSSDEDLAQNLIETEGINIEDLILENTNSLEQETAAALELPKSRWLHNSSRKMTNLEIPKRDELFERLENDSLAIGPSCHSFLVETAVDGYQNAEDAISSENDYMAEKQNLIDEQHEENEIEAVPEESILRRINSRKGLQSYQLGKQLSCKWTTGAGPRIHCVRDYPSELQFQALEQVNLSPRSACHSRSYFSPRSTSALSRKVSAPISFGAEMAVSSPVLEKGDLLQRNVHPSRTLSSPFCTEEHQ